MNLLAAFLAFLLAFAFLMTGITRVGAWLIERNNPPTGTFATVDGTRMHYVHVPAPSAALPPVVFVHGASSNLRDLMLPLRPLLEGRAEMLFVDRPGHGWSARGSGNGDPFGQADTIAALMRHVGIDRAIIVGHSFGGAVAATFALRHADMTAGLVFLSPASHPWPGGGTSWYYTLTAVPVLGRLFAETLALPGGTIRIAAASTCVFSPNRLPEDYDARAGIRLVLRPAAFRANARDVAGLYEHVVKVAPRYGEIAAPTVIVSGTRDTVVYEEIHSRGLGRDIPGAELVWVDNLGHKPDWITPELAVAAIEKVAGGAVDLDAAARAAERRLADDLLDPANQCPEPEIGLAEAER